MGRQKCKNTLNNTKRYMAPPEISGPTLARPEQHNTNVAEGNKTKNNLMKMIRGLKEEIKNSFNEMEERWNIGRNQ